MAFIPEDYDHVCVITVCKSLPPSLVDCVKSLLALPASSKMKGRKQTPEVVYQFHLDEEQFLFLFLHRS